MFCAVFLATSGVAFAATCQCGWTTCATNQYCVENYYWDQEEQIWDYDYYCEDCPSGQVHSNNDCFQCVQAPCQGYTDCPAGIGDSGKKCKVITGEDGCPSGSGCTKYEICNTNNNAITYQVDGSSCHLEGSGHHCQPNTVPCSSFYVDGQHGEWTCKSSDEVGQAQWDNNKWYVGNCTCGYTDRDVGGIGTAWESRCKRGTAEFIIYPGDLYADSLDDALYYVPTRMYCSTCYAGYLPDIIAAKTTQEAPYPVLYYNDGGNSTWGAMMCSARVSAPYYTDGTKRINFSLSTGQEAIDDYVQHCPVGTKTNQNGATSVSQCNLLDTDQRFQDDTGIFTITSTAQCSNNP